jgi:predicted metalloprotease with PDZ domain
MRLLWRRYGRDFDRDRRGLEEDGFAELLREATGVDLATQIRAWTEGTAELPLAPLLKGFGVALDLKRADGESPWLGIRTATKEGDLTIATAYRDGPAQRAGLSAGDVIVAAGGLRVDDKGLKALLARRRVGEKLRLHVYRRDELLEFEATLERAPETEAALSLVDRAPASAKRLGKNWLRIRNAREHRTNRG